jgi:hypothetical protein
MSDISSQLIKDSYNYILQSDLSTGVVYRIGGDIPVNPIFSSGLTINENFNFSNGTEQSGYILMSDSFGNATWVENPSGPSGDYLPLSGGTVTGPTIFTSGLTANTISATTYYNLSSNFKNEIHVSQVDGNDTTGDGSLLNPVATIIEGLTLITGQRRTIIIHPGNYTENPNISSQYTVLTTYELLGSNTLISGTISTNVGCTISGIKMTNLNISNLTGTGNVNILNCDISGTLTKSNTGDYTLIRFCDIGTTSITGGGGLVAIFGGNPNFITVNNVAARVIVKNAVTVAPVLTSGGLTFADCIILSTGNTSNAFTAAAGTLTTLANSQIIVPTFNNVARVSLSGFYSIFNTIYDKPNSTLVALSSTGGSTNSIDYFQYINADKFITQGGTSLQYVMGDGSLSNGFTGGTVTGATSFTGGLTANTISATTYQNLPATPFLPLSGGTVSGATNFTSGLTANTISATTYYNLPKDIFVTGGTYNNGDATFTNNSGGTFTVTGFAVGGGGGQIFYLNLSQSQNGNRLLSTTASTASEQSTGVTISKGVTSTISSFQSQPLNTTLLPGGIWSFYLHSYKQNTNASFDIFVELYKITSGGTQTLLFSTDPAPVTTNSPNPSMQLSDGYFSGTPLSVSDSIVAVVRATNTSNQSHIITLVTEGSQHYSYAVSTIPTQQGLTCDTLSGCSIIQTIQTDVSNKLDKSGGTITGNLVINSGLTSNTISATTYYNLPKDIFVTGGTYNNGTATFTNNSGGTFNISGFSTSTGASFTGGTVSGATNFTNGLTANTISATTYYNLPPSSAKSINSVSINTNAGSNQSTDYFYFASNSITITLPTAISNTNSYVIKNVGTGTITINTTSSQTIDGSLTALIKVQYLSLTIISDGANWNII